MGWADSTYCVVGCNLPARKGRTLLVGGSSVYFPKEKAKLIVVSWLSWKWNKLSIKGVSYPKVSPSLGTITGQVPPDDCSGILPTSLGNLHSFPDFNPEVL